LKTLSKLPKFESKDDDDDEAEFLAALEEDPEKAL